MLCMIIEKLRKRIEKSGKSLNQIGRDTGIDKAALSRIMNGGSCKVETADILFKYFGLTVTEKKSPKKAKAKK
jgi:transcriptional regulator with XRE-family HTH domain